jgi:hypothetical protein
VKALNPFDEIVQVALTGEGKGRWRSRLAPHELIGPLDEWRIETSVPRNRLVLSILDHDSDNDDYLME